MRLALFVLGSLIATISSDAQFNQFYNWGNYPDPGYYYFRQNYSPTKKYDNYLPPVAPQLPSGRLFFTTVTLTLSTTTR